MYRSASPKTKRPSRIASNLYLSPWDESSVETVPRSNQSRRLYYPNGVEPTVSSVIIATLVIMLTISLSHHIASTLLMYHDKLQLKINLQDSSRTLDTREELPNWTKSTMEIWATRNDTLQQEIALFWHIIDSDGPNATTFFSKCLGLTSGHFIWSDNMDLNKMTMRINVHTDKSSADSKHVPFSAGTVVSNEGSEFQTVGESTFLELKVPEIVLIDRIDLVSHILDAFSAANKVEPRYLFLAFVILHHPFDYALLEYMDKTNLQQDAASYISLKQYFTSNEYKDNAHVRMLNGIWNDLGVPVTKHHLAVAKAILRQKFLVGIYERLSESMIRFEKYYGWWRKDNGTDNKVNDYCQSLMNVKGNSDLEQFASSADTFRVHNVVMKRNWADIELYSYAQVVFDEQETLIRNYIIR